MNNHTNIFDSIIISCNNALNGITKPQYIPNTRNSQIAAISDIKQNGPATIIFLKNGNKVVVKCQDNEQDNRLGLYMCLIKYLVYNNRIYSSCIDYIFNTSDELLQIMKAEAMIISHIGITDLTEIVNKTLF